MKTKIDVENWNRRDYYRYFGSFDDPYFGVVVNVDCTEAYRYCKKQKLSFFLHYLYASIKAVNLVENFRYRIIDGEVWLFDRVHPSSVVAREDDSFGFAHFEYTDDFASFVKDAKAKMAEVQTYQGLRWQNNTRFDVVYYTVLPWFSFTGLKHERNIARGESITTIAFGKFFKADDKLLMPMSVNANHGLVDGYHIGRYLELFQKLLAEKTT